MPPDKPPNWQQIVKGENPQLAIDQTIGLEPQFTLYQIGPRKFLPNPVQLTAISLEEFAFNDETYKNGLRLAQSGLWSPALNVMRGAKGKASKNWPAVAQAQLETIEFHAKITGLRRSASGQSRSTSSRRIDRRPLDKLCKYLKPMRATVTK